MIRSGPRVAAPATARSRWRSRRSLSSGTIPDSDGSSSPSIGRCKLLDIGLAREQEPQQAQALASQGLVDAQEHEVVLETGFGDRGAKKPPAGSHELDGVLGAV